MAAQTPETLRVRLWLMQSEKVVLKAIRESDIPFLGLLGELLTPEMRQAVAKAISVNPSVTGYIKHLETHPALFAVNLAWHVMHGVGQRGYFSVYPYIEEALYLNRKLSQNEPELLWQAFRRALLYLGLEPSPRISGSNFMVNEYLRQVGVPLPFVDDLAQRMLAFAHKVGLPEDDNPESIESWQTSLHARLEPPFSVTASNAVAFDHHGYYTRIFLRVHAAGGVPQNNNNKLELAMAQAFKEDQVSTLRRAVIPHVALRDGLLAIVFPGGAEQEWTVTVDGAAQQYHTGVDERLLPISRGRLPHEVNIRSHSGDQKSRIQLWEDDKLNRLLFFTATGRLAGRGQLGQEETQVLLPGIYTVLSRFEPTGVDAEEMSDEPRLFCFPLSLHPGDSHALSNGPATLMIHADRQPLIHWRGPSHHTKDGVEFRYGLVNLDVEIPPDWLPAGASYELMLRPTERGSACIVPLMLDENGRGTVSDSDIANKAAWKPGLMRLLIELRRTGESRTLLRTANLYWLGLKEISRGLRFLCATWPENLDLKFSENMVRTGNDLTLGDASKRNVRLVFALNEKRQQSLTWNVPGVFVEVEAVAENGKTQRVRRVLGSTESISLTSAKQIVVSASDPGILRLGEWSQRVDFARHPTKPLTAAFLASRLTPKSSTLIYVNEITHTNLELLKLAKPHEVGKFSAQMHSGRFVVRLHMSEPLEMLAVQALELLSGEEDTFVVQANASAPINSRFGRPQLMVLNDPNGGYSAYLYINLSFWPAGAWLFNFEGRVKGILGQLENSRQDVFSAGLLLGEDGQVLSQKAWLDQVNVLEDKTARKLMRRVHAAVLRCYAQEAWESLSWLVATWQILIEQWRGKEADVLTTLADLIAMRSPDDASVSWLPQLSAAAALPGVFSLPAAQYKRVNEKPHPISRALRAMGDMEDKYPLVFPMLFDGVAAVGFNNIQGVRRGAAPKGFNPARYSEAISRVDSYAYIYRLDDEEFLPGPGDYLGPLHYRHAWRCLEIAYERALAGNDIYRGQGIGLATHAHRLNPHLTGSGIPAAWQGRAPHLVPWPMRSDAIEDDLLLQQYDNLTHIAHLLAYLAFACRQETRFPGALKDYLNRLSSIGTPLDRPLAFLLQIGDALFAYYLLLWELTIKADA